MSLLNQVLQDLDERAPAGEPRQVHLSVAPATDRYADGQEAEGPNRVRLAAGVAVVSAFVAAVWIFHSAGEDRAERQEAVQAKVAPIVAEETSAPVHAPVPAAGVAAEQDSTITDSAEESGPPPVAVVDHEARPEPAALLVTEASMAAPAIPVSELQAASDNSPAVPPQSISGPTYLPLRNTELPAEEETSPAARRVERTAGVRVKTAKSPVPEAVEQARVAIEQGELSSAEVLLQRRLQVAPGDQDARELLVGLMLRGDRQDAVMQQLEQGLKKQPGHVKFSLIKARLLAQQGEVAAAIGLLEAPTSSPVGRVERLQMLGALYQQQARYEQAVGSYRSLLELNSSVGSSWVGLAISLDGLGDSAASQAYRRALQLGGLPAAAETYARQRVSQLESTID